MAGKLELSSAGVKAIMEMSGSQAFYKEVINEVNLHARKNADYNDPSVQNGFANFILAASFARVTPQQVFGVLRGVKWARLQHLMFTAVQPKNESVEDTMRDLAVYQQLELAFKETYPELYSRNFVIGPVFDLAQSIQDLVETVA